MSTTAIVIIAVLTAALAVGALWFLRWQEQQRLERARLAVACTDLMGELNMIGESVAPWASPEMMTFLAGEIQRQAQILNELKSPVNHRINQALENAANWSAGQKAAKANMPAQSQQAQNLRNTLLRLMDYIRDSYKSRHLDGNRAKSLLNEAKFLNIKVAVAVYEGKAAAAATLSNHSQAIHYLRKAIATLKRVNPLPDDMTSLMNALSERLEEHLSVQRQQNTGTRLESGTEKLAEDDDAWKKKHF